jgi:hypothetical protein
MRLCENHSAAHLGARLIQLVRLTRIRDVAESGPSILLLRPSDGFERFHTASPWKRTPLRRRVSVGFGPILLKKSAGPIGSAMFDPILRSL